MEINDNMEIQEMQDTQEIEEQKQNTSVSLDEKNSSIKEQPETEKVEAEPTNKTFTQDQVNEIVKNRLEKERKKFEKTKNKYIDEASFEASLIEREKNISLKEKKFSMALKIQDNNLPLDLVNHIDYTDDTTMEKSFESLKSLFNEKLKQAVEAHVQERLKGSTPKMSVSNHKDVHSCISEIFKR